MFADKKKSFFYYVYLICALTVSQLVLEYLYRDVSMYLLQPLICIPLMISCYICFHLQSKPLSFLAVVLLTVCGCAINTYYFFAIFPAVLCLWTLTRFFSTDADGQSEQNTRCLLLVIGGEISAIAFGIYAAATQMAGQAYKEWELLYVFLRPYVCAAAVFLLILSLSSLIFGKGGKATETKKTFKPRPKKKKNRTSDALWLIPTFYLVHGIVLLIITAYCLRMDYSWYDSKYILAVWSIFTPYFIYKSHQLYGSKNKAGLALQQKINRWI